MPITHTASQSLGTLLNLGGRRSQPQEGRDFQQIMERNWASSQPVAETRGSAAQPQPASKKAAAADSTPDQVQRPDTRTTNNPDAADKPAGEEVGEAEKDPASEVDEALANETADGSVDESSVQSPAAETDIEPDSSALATPATQQALSPAPVPTNGEPAGLSLEVGSLSEADGAAQPSPALSAEQSESAVISNSRPLHPTPGAGGANPGQPFVLMPESLSGLEQAPLNSALTQLPLAQAVAGQRLPQPEQLAAKPATPFNVQLASTASNGVLSEADALSETQLELEALGLKPEAAPKFNPGPKAPALEVTGLNGKVMQASAALNGTPLNPQVLDVSRAEVKPTAEGPAALSPLAGAARPGVMNGVRPAPVTVPVSQPNWAQATGERVLWMVHQKLQSAEIQLDPPELGPLQVRVSVHNDQVSVSFVSAHGQVRDALDMQSLRLREMFEAQGLNLVDVDVSDQGFHGNQSGDAPANPFSTGSEVADEAVSLTETPLNSDRLIDQFV